MGNHRADRDATRRPRSTGSSPQPYVGRRIANRPVDSAPQVGETFAVIPVPAPAQAPAPAAFDEDVRVEDQIDFPRTSPAPTVEIPVLSAHELRAELRAATTGSLKPAVPGKRRAVEHAGPRGPLFKGLPSVPVLVGAATLAIAIGGAVTTAHTTLASHQTAIAAPNAMSGSFGSASQGGQRTETVSRDSDRQTLQAATDTELVSEADRVSAQRNSALGVLAKDAEKQAQVIALNRWITPIAPGVYHLTARFGQCSGLWGNCHTGLDFAAPTGTPIRAVADGVIASTGYDGSYGNKTVETLDDGTELWYAHQTAFNVSPGQQVRQGDIIGYVGSTGNTTGPHVHLEVRPGGGDPVDPFAALVEHGVTP
jgi:murein DD-endopeptidase MepM/ murein hydrolase activator NlpD